MKVDPHGKFASNNGNSARILSILSMKKLFIIEAIVRGESYFGNVVCLFRPSKVSTILKSFFSDHHCNISDLLYHYVWY